MMFGHATRSRGAPAGRRARRGAGPSDHEAPLGPFGVAAIIASLVFLVAGIVAPQAAEALLRLLLATLAMAFVAARAYDAMLPAKTTQDVYSPFEDESEARRPPAAPLAVRELARELAGADDARLARRTAIPWRVQRRLVDEASRRLSERHGLRLDDPSDHAGVRALVSEPTWSLLEPGAGETVFGARVIAGSRPVPLSQLHLILDDLERL